MDRAYFTWASVWWTSIEKKIAIIENIIKKLNIQNDSIIEEKTNIPTQETSCTHTHRHTPLMNDRI